MCPKIILLIVCLATFTSGAVHVPRVHEDQIESGSVRNVRNPVVKQKVAAFQPPTFNFRLAQQQDHMKHRYAQQQKLDFKNELYMRGPAANVYPQGRYLAEPQLEQSEVNENWQPFQPKQDLNRQPKMQTSASTKSSEIVHEPAKRSEQTNRKNSTNSDTASSKAIIKKQDINRQDDPPFNFDGEIVYVHPDLLKQFLGKNGPIQNPNSIGGVHELKYNALSDLVGKTPNFQLEGLKQILMQDSHTPAHPVIHPVIKGPKPFKPKDHTPIVEKSIDIPNPRSRPNVQVDHEESPPPLVASLLQQSPAISQNSLEDLQKQLDEASNIEAQKVWEKATQDAKAHVEAQHKAIEDAQKAILQKYNFEGNPQALALIQKELPAYSLPTNYQSQQAAEEQNFYSTPQPNLQDANQILEQSKSNAGLPAPANYVTQDNNEEVYRVNIPTEHHAVVHQATPVQQVSKPVSRPTKKKPVHQYPSKNVEFYAPNHLHQAASQLQAEKALAAQVESQNSIILNNYKKQPNVKQDFNDVHKVVDTFQQIEVDHEDSGKVKNIHKKSANQQDDVHDSQYAARYAFGYSIKDAKAGNFFGHQERRIGKSAEGSYYVVLPDGRKQNVQYYADTSGYHAKVTYENAQHS